MSSAAEAELGALYINAHEAVPQCCTLEEMGHKQPPTLMQTDNTTAVGVVNNNIQPKQADRAYGMEISPTLFVISFVILLYAISYNICI
jgi:hypothetical protein